MGEANALYNIFMLEDKGLSNAQTRRAWNRLIIRTRHKKQLQEVLARLDDIDPDRRLDATELSEATLQASNLRRLCDFDAEDPHVDGCLVAVASFVLLAVVLFFQRRFNTKRQSD